MGIFNFEQKLKKEGLWEPEKDEWEEKWKKKDLWGDEEEDEWKKQDKEWEWTEEDYPESIIKFPVKTEKTIHKIPSFIIGFIFTGVGIPCSLVLLFLHKTDFMHGFLFKGLLVLVVIGIIMLFYFRRNYKTVMSFYRCINLIGNRMDMDIQEFADAENVSLEEATKMIDRFIDLDFLPEGRIDRKTNRLYTTLEGFQNR